MNQKHFGFLRFFVLCLIGVCMAIPFLWMVTASLKTRAEADSPDFFSKSPTLNNYAIVLNEKADPTTHQFLNLRFGRWYFNSIFVAAAVTAVQVLTSAMAAYAFSRMQWRWRDKLFFVYLGTMMIPSVITVVPNFALMVKLNMLNSYEGLIFPAAFSAFGTFLLRQYMLSISTVFDEAAKIDGASHWHIFWEIILPLARPGLIVLAIITFLGNYQSFYWPLVLLQDPQLFTLPVGMMELDNSYGRQTEMIMAAMVMNIAPLVVVFICCQRYLINSLQFGGVKG